MPVEGLILIGIDSKNPDWIVNQVDYLEKFFYKYRYFMENSQSFFISMMLLVSDLGVTQYNWDKICLINLTLIYGLKTIYISVDMFTKFQTRQKCIYNFLHVFFKIAIFINSGFIIFTLIF